MDGTAKLYLFCDASFDHEFGVGGWGGWTKREEWLEGQFFGSPFRRQFSSANEAELWAMVNAMAHVVSQDLLAGVNRIELSSDSVHALVVLKHAVYRSYIVAAPGSDLIQQGHMPFLSDMTREAIRHIFIMLDDYRVNLGLRFVKGHVPSSERQHFINGTCDAIAHRYMREARGAARGMQPAPGTELRHANGNPVRRVDQPLG